ncbi:hypothetical protein Bbelb_331010 [Branchiostoma belcheri]|nr:hypothetical protein Bbelb_331010 [Branchiostoma belcheri]
MVFGGSQRQALDVSDKGCRWKARKILTHQQAATIEQVQKRACRTSLGKHYTDYASALQQCGLETLENRRVNLCHKFAVSMEKSERTADLLPPTRGQSTRRELRNSTKRTLPTTRLQVADRPTAMCDRQTRSNRLQENDEPEVLLVP